MPYPEKGWTRIPLRETQWCDPSLVLAYQDGVRWILASDRARKIKEIILLSGADIPIRSAQYVYNLPDKSRLCFEGPIETKAFPEKVTSFLAAHQWQSLNREDAERIAQTDFGTFAPFEKEQKQVFKKQDMIDYAKTELKRRQEKLRALIAEGKSAPFVNLAKYHLHLAERLLQRFQKESSDTVKIYTECPDETHIPLALLLKGKSEDDMLGTKSNCGTVLFKPGDLGDVIPSPYEWDSWSTELATRSSRPDSPAQILNLERFIQSKCRNPQYLFLRKVTSSLPYRETWKICK